MWVEYIFVDAFQKMGRLANKLPYTYFFILIGSIALSGIPPFAGYFSKDLILEYGLSMHTLNGFNVYLFGCIGAFLTAVYSYAGIYLVNRFALLEEFHLM